MNLARTLETTIARGRDGLPTLDGWRALAILLVVLGHSMDDIASALGRIGGPEVPSGLKYIGMHGVQVFFGLSGLLITTRLLAEEARHGRISLPGFYVRRAFRILPAAGVFLAVVGLLGLAGVIELTPGRWLASLLFAANYSTAEYSWYLGHFWSLAVEEHFYLVWPAVFAGLAVVRRRLAWAVAIACAVAAWRALDFRFQITGTSAAMFMGRTDIQADHLLWGAVIALAYADPGWRPRLQAFLARPRNLLLLLGALFALFAVHDVGWKLKFVLLSVHAVLVPLAILGTCLQARSLAGQILEWPLLRLIGRLSFSIYLWQQLFFVWSDARVAALAPLQSYPYNIIAVLVCACASFWLVEEPAIRAGRNWLARRSRTDRPAGSPEGLLQGAVKS